MRNLFLTVILFSVTLLYAQAPEIEWQKSLGGSSLDVAFSIQQTSDGGYIAAGYSYSNDGDVSGNHGESDYWVVKLDHIGNIQWEKSLGGSGYEGANSIQQTTDGGYILAGWSDSNDGDISGNHGSTDYWVVKLDDTGTIEWQKSIGGSAEDRAYSIQQTFDGGYITAGYSYSNNGDISGNHGASDYWVVKLDDTGTIEWQKSLGGSGDEWAHSIQQTSDSGYIVAGGSFSNDGDVSGNHGYDDSWVVKLDNAGNIQWQKCLGGSGDEWVESIQQTSDGGYIIAGTSTSNDGDVNGHHGSSDYWVVKLDDTGNIQWQKCLGGSASEFAFFIQQTSDGGYIVAGDSYSNDGDLSGNHGDYDSWVVKLDDIGNIEWQKCLGGRSDDGMNSIQQTSDGGYIAAGYSRSNNSDVSGNHGNKDFWIVKLSGGPGILSYEINTSSNPEEGGTTSGGGVFEYGTSVTVSALANAGYSFVNWTEDGTEVSNDTEYTFVAIENRNIVANFDYEMAVADIENNRVKIYPNPVTGLLTIKGISLKTELIITNTYGEIVFKTVTKNNELTIDVSELPAGMYFINGQKFIKK